MFCLQEGVSRLHPTQIFNTKKMAFGDFCRTTIKFVSINKIQEHVRMSIENISYKHWSGTCNSHGVEIDFGQERIIDVQNNIHKFDTPTFYGYCYYCDYSKHSQNYCPLRFCFLCKTYGHSVKVCIKNSAHKSVDWRSKIQKDTNPWKGKHLSLSQKPDVICDKQKTTYKKDLRHGNNFQHWKRVYSFDKNRREDQRQFEKIKIPFGSTWKQNTNVSFHASTDQELDWRRSMTKSFNCGVLVELDSS